MHVITKAMTVVETAGGLPVTEDVEDIRDDLEDETSDDEPGTGGPLYAIGSVEVLHRVDEDDDVPEWQERALCAQTDPEAFFPEKGGSTREAKRICLGCEVRAECLDYALAHDERFGIWGGLSERERRRLRRPAV